MEVLIVVARLFETIDEDAEEGEAKRVDYWGIYSK